jgi:kynurenine formamidase
VYRRHMARALSLLVLLIAAPAPAQLPRGRVIDLSHSYGPDTLYWPTSRPFKLDKVSDGVTARGFYYAANDFCTAEHGGTHVDAPIHFARGHATVDRIPLEQLIGPAVVVDVTAASARDRDYQVTVADLQAWEKAHRPIGAEIVLLRTGWAARWPDARTYLGTVERGAAGAAQLHFPGLHPDAARWLADKRVRVVGIDTASIDHGPSTQFLTHQTLFARDIPALENVADLSALPAVGATVIALPMKIAGGSGAPVRIVALLP